MSIRGRKPVPTTLRELHGNPRMKALPRNEPVPVGELGDPPEWFSVEQKQGWDWALTNSPPGMLKLVDRGSLITWVVAEDLHRQACIQQAKVGLLIKAPVTGALVQSPFLPIINRQALIMLKAGGELGFTPVSRPRLADRTGQAAPSGAMSPPSGRKRAGGAVVSLQEFLRSKPA